MLQFANSFSWSAAVGTLEMLNFQFYVFCVLVELPGGCAKATCLFQNHGFVALPGLDRNFLNVCVSVAHPEREPEASASSQVTPCFEAYFFIF